MFKDTDGSYYIVYGGWRHCNIAKLNADFTGFVPFPDGSVFKEITPAESEKLNALSSQVVRYFQSGKYDLALTVAQEFRDLAITIDGG